MATLSTAERNAMMDQLLAACGEDVRTAGSALRATKLSLGAVTNWDTVFRARAALWAPFTSIGLSVTWWCDLVVADSNKSR